MASHVDLLTELQLLEKVPTLERLRAAQKRRAQQLKKWAQYEQDLQHRKRKHERKRSTGGRRKKVSFEASVALLEASLRNDAEEVIWVLSGGVEAASRQQALSPDYVQLPGSMTKPGAPSWLGRLLHAGELVPGQLLGR
ncbi:hypothetical protein J1605_015835 [Eschrichtius robustus]|uniref:Protein phosphatase 1 regulatory inhibitor subunit 16B n=1 Tax=Eschrichtius robustus TaxID=9764 RepID=A0AB34G9D2_ESCRO|nr:hypothetical protein J1605_015835 [Eschrichtius robustus]